MSTNRGKRIRSQVTTSGFTDGQIDHLISGYNFFDAGGDYGDNAPFRDEEHRREVWLQVRKDFLQRMILEAEQDGLGQWSWRGAYLPWGVTQESINAYWTCERGEPMPWPEAPTLDKMNGGKKENGKDGKDGVSI